MVTLRDYQLDCSNKIIEAFRTHRSTLLALYTGGGKTLIFADVIRRMQPGRALVLAHREELIFQAKDKIENTTGLACDIEMADFRAHHHALFKTPVVVSTVQTQNAGRQTKRMNGFDPNEFNLVVYDECHRATSPIYRTTQAYYGQNPNIKFLGVTATPDRHDQQALGEVFECVAANYQILDGIEQGWLCDVTQQFIKVKDLDYSDVKTVAGDFNMGQLQAVLDAERIIAGMLQPSIEVVFGLDQKTLTNIHTTKWPEILAPKIDTARRTIVFTASVKQAEEFCNQFNRVVPGMAGWVCGETKKEIRRTLLRDFSKGSIKVVCNVGCLTEGFDDAGVQVIIMARPTKSRGLYAQMVGRSTRPLPGIVDGPGLETADARKAAILASGKPFCRIIDFVDISNLKLVVTTHDILGGRVSEKVLQYAKQKAIAEQVAGGKPVRVVRNLSNAENDLKHKQEMEAQKRRQEEEARKAHLVAKSNFSVHETNPFDTTKGHKTKSVTIYPKEPCTIRQATVLGRNGWPHFKLTKKQAGAIIGEYVANDWKETPHLKQWKEALCKP